MKENHRGFGIIDCSFKLVRRPSPPLIPDKREVLVTLLSLDAHLQQKVPCGILV
jgi:hypothetical protein